MKRTYYRMKTGFGQADINYNTLEEAREGVATYNSLPEDNEHYEYWEKKKAELTIVKVTEIEEAIGSMFNDETLEKGRELIAIDSCMVEYSKHESLPALIIGKSYEIIDGVKEDGFGDECIKIQSELGSEHSFNVDNLKRYFVPNMEA